MAPGLIMQVGRLNVQLLRRRDEGDLRIEIWEGVDQRGASPLLVTRVLNEPTIDLARLLADVPALARLRAPSIAAVIDFEAWDGGLIVVQPLLAGRPLSQCLEAGPLALDQAFALAEDGLTALADFHEQGLLHGDLQPKRFLLAGDRYILVDLGVAGKLIGRDAEPAVERISGFAAPESLGLLHNACSPSSDLYSLGLVVRWALGGQTPGAPLEWRLQVPERLPGLPPAAQLFLDRLCQPDPENRYQTALGALADLRRLRDQPYQSVFPLGTHDDRATLISPGLGGRQQEVEQLCRWLATEPSPIFLEAPSGQGKSHLLAVLGERLAAQGAEIFQVRALAPQGGVGRPVWPELSSLIGQWCRATPGAVDRLLGALTDPEKCLLGQAFPGWSFLGSSPPRASLPQSTALDAVVKALAQLGRIRKIGLLLDDAHWADPLTVGLLERSIENVMIVAAFCRDESPQALATRGRRVLELSPLSKEASRELLSSMAGPLAEEVWQPLAEQAQGDPFLLQSLLRGAVENGDLVAKKKGIGWEWLAPSRHQTDRAGAWRLSKRLRHICPHARALLTAGAVLGVSFSSRLAGQLAKRPADLLSQAVARHLVWLDGDQASFTHELIRSALLEDLGAQKQSELHGQAAEHLEALAGSLAEIAYHWQAAGHPERGLSAAVGAARLADGEFHYQRARDLWSLAREGLSSETAAEISSQIEIGLARATYLAGNPCAAIPLYRRAVECLDDPLKRASLIAEQLTAQSRSFQFEDLLKLAVQGLEQLGIKVPVGAARQWAEVGKEAFRMMAHLRRPLRHRSSLRAQVAGKLLVALTESCARSQNTSLLLWSACRACRYLYGADAPGEAAIAYSYASLVVGHLGATKTRSRLSQMAETVARSHPWALGQVRGMSGILALQDGNLTSALRRFDSAIPFCIAYGDRWNQQVSQLHRGLVQHAMGRFQDSRPDLREIMTLADLADDGLRLCAATLLARAGHWEELTEWTPDSLPQFQGTFLQLVSLQLQGLLWLKQGAWGQAVMALESAVSDYRPEAGFHGAASAAWLSLAWRMLAESLPPEGLALRQKLLSQARRAIRTGQKHTKAWLIHQPHLLREQAILQALQGRFPRSRSLFESSLALSRRLGMGFESAWTLYERGRMAQAAGWSDWQNDRARGLDWLHRWGGWIPNLKLPGPPPQKHLAKLDRFDKVLEAGRRLVRLSGNQDLIEVLLDQARTLLRCDVLFLDRAQALSVVDQDAEDLVCRCLSQGRAVTNKAAEARAPGKLLPQARSTLAAPVFREQELVGVLVAHHKNISGFFGPDETRLADYLTTLTGAGLENFRILADRDRAYSSLHTSERRFRDFFQYAGVGTALLDGEGYVLEENPFWRHLLGQETTGLALWDVCHSEDRQALRQGLARLGATRFDLEARLHRSGGEVVWVQLCLTRLPIQDQDQTRMLATIADTTHRRLDEMMIFLQNERRGLAAEVHDEIAQTVSALHMMLAAGDAAAGQLEPARALCQQLGRDTSRLVASLRHPLPESGEVLPALRCLATDFAVETEIDVESSWPSSEPSVTPAGALVLCRVLQEGLANIGKHAAASKVTLALTVVEKRLEMRLADNGRGFNAQPWLRRSNPKRHFGLLSIRDRVQMAGGQFQVRPVDPHGTELVVHLPCQTP